MWEDDPNRVFKVVLNHEEQYSIWPEDKENPNGWRSEGKVGTKEECLSYIDEVWTDMRPLSLRKFMEEQEAKAKRGEQVQEIDEELNKLLQGPSLPERLSQVEHKVEVSLRPDKTVDRFKECLDRGYVHIKFIETRGGTELLVELDQDESDLSAADFEAGTGTVQLVGGLTLDFVPVRCVASIDLETLNGTGHLHLVEVQK